MEKLSPGLGLMAESTKEQKGKIGAGRSNRGVKLSDLMMERLEMFRRWFLGEDFIRDRVGRDAGNHSIWAREQLGY